MLRYHKMENRYVPQNIEKGDDDVLQNYLNLSEIGLKIKQHQLQLIRFRVCLLAISAPQKISPEQKKLEDKFKSENFDLINWFIISNK